eukprot:5607379-Lingulodinium_polyedra.AAC.1
MGAAVACEGRVPLRPQAAPRPLAPPALTGRRPPLHLPSSSDLPDCLAGGALGPPCSREKTSHPPQ